MAVGTLRYKFLFRAKGLRSGIRSVTSLPIGGSWRRYLPLGHGTLAHTRYFPRCLYGYPPSSGFITPVIVYERILGEHRAAPYRAGR
jgi:hypothetical protein